VLYLSKKKAPKRGFFSQNCNEIALCRDDINSSTFSWSAYGEVNVTVCLSKQSVVTTHAHVVTSMKLSATLTNNDVAGFN